MLPNSRKAAIVGTEPVIPSSSSDVSFTLVRVCASLGLRIKFKTNFISDEEKHSYHFVNDLQNLSRG